MFITDIQTKLSSCYVDVVKKNVMSDYSINLTGVRRLGRALREVPYYQGAVLVLVQ